MRISAGATLTRRTTTRLAAVLVGCGVLLAARQADAVCKMVINVDRTASMMSLRDNGQTKCQVAQNAVLLILDAYWRGLDFDITMPGQGATVRAEFEANCPCPGCSMGGDLNATAATRLVQVREFRGDIMEPLWAGDMIDRELSRAAPSRPKAGRLWQSYLRSFASASLSFLYSPSASPASKPSRTRRTMPLSSATNVDGMWSDP
jgi:hypothetical protein